MDKPLQMPAKLKAPKTLRDRLALGLFSLGRGLHRGAAIMAGFGGGRGGYDAARPGTRRTRGWQPGEGSAAADDLADLPTLRGRSRDLDRNNSIAHGAANTKVNGAIGSGLVMRSVLDAKVLGIEDQDRITELQYQIEREWELFEREADFTGQMHLRDWQRVAFRSAKVSGDIGVARRYVKRPGQVYGTKVVLIEADRICNPNRRADTPEIQGGVQLGSSGEILGYHVTDRHPGDIMPGMLRWSYVPARGPSGLLQFILAAEIERPGQVRGVPLFAAVEEDLKQLGSYSAAEIKAAINDAYLFAFEETPAELDDDGNPILTRADGQQDDAGELTLDDLSVVTLPPGRKVTTKVPARPNTAFEGFVAAFCKQVGAALGIPYELLLMRFEASFSASRGALELAYKVAMIEQSWFVRSVLMPIREWQFTEMVASGRFDAPGFFTDPIKRAAWLDCMWIGPTRVQINPQVEANADETDINMGAKTLEQVMTERTGGSFDTKSRQVLKERAVLGVSSAPAAKPLSVPAPAAPSPAPKPAPEEPNGPKAPEGAPHDDPAGRDDGDPADTVDDALAAAVMEITSKALGRLAIGERVIAEAEIVAQGVLILSAEQYDRREHVGGGAMIEVLDRKAEGDVICRVLDPIAFAAGERVRFVDNILGNARPASSPSAPNLPFGGIALGELQ